MQPQSQAEVSGDYSVTEPSLLSALNFSYRAVPSPTGPAPMKVCSEERLCEEKQGILDIFLKALRSHRDTALMPPDISQQSGPAKAGPPFVYPNNPLEHSNGAKAGWLGG